MRIVCISDTHMAHRTLDPLPEGDVLIHAGDALNEGTEKEFWSFSIWMAQQRYALKIYVPGNHDFWVQANPDIAKCLMKEGGTHMLVDSCVKFEGLKFCGSPWVPNLEGWAYYGGHLTLLRHFQAIPQDIDVLITHCPPLGMGDEVSRSHVGSTELRDAIGDMHSLKLHVFGHIHEGYGQRNGAMKEDGSRVAFVNAAIMTGEYKPTNRPIVIDLDL